MGKIGSGLQMPAPTPLDEFDAATLILLDKLAEREIHVALPDMLGDFIHGQRARGREQRRFNGAHQLVHQAATFRRIGAKASSWSISRRPLRASSSAARKLEASADRRS